MEKVAHNVFIDSSKVISYQTHVADIVDGKLIENGKYSMSTSRQMSKLANKLGLTLVRSKKKRTDFDWLWMGVKC
jgi:hypothetical protein